MLVSPTTQDPFPRTTLGLPLLSLDCPCSVTKSHPTKEGRGNCILRTSIAQTAIFCLYFFLITLLLQKNRDFRSPFQVCRTVGFWKIVLFLILRYTHHAKFAPVTNCVSLSSNMYCISNIASALIQD
jgi:hypothetical protein